MKHLWHNGSILELIFHPVLPLIAFLFFAITTLHHQISPLQSLPIENALLIFIFVNTIFWCVFNKPKLLSPWFYFLVVGFALSPLLTSFVQDDYLQVIFDSEYRTYLRMLLISPVLIYFLRDVKTQRLILSVVLISFTILGLIFLYRLFILGEVRSFDLRPELQIRHGDANFLGTFFAMIFPWAIFYGWNKQRSERLLSYTMAAFFIVCSLLTESRMAIISIAVTSIYFLITVLQGRQRLYGLLIFVLVGSFASLLVGERVLERFKGIDDKSNYDRTLTLVNGLKVFAASPIVGAGLHKTSESFFDNTESPPFRSEMKSLDVHNAFLKAFSDLGSIGGLLYFFIFISPWIVFIKTGDKRIQILKSSWIILFLCCLSVGVTYKDLIFLNIFLLIGVSESLKPSSHFRLKAL